MRRVRSLAGIDVILTPEARVIGNTSGWLSAVPAYAWKIRETSALLASFFSKRFSRSGILPWTATYSTNPHGMGAARLILKQAAGTVKTLGHRLLS